MDNCQLCDKPCDQDRGYVILQRFSPAAAEGCSTVNKRVCGDCLDRAAGLLITMTGRDEVDAVLREWPNQSDTSRLNELSGKHELLVQQRQQIQRGARWERLLYEVVAEGCLRRATEFRGKCGRDGAAIDTWCVVCRCMEALAETK